MRKTKLFRLALVLCLAALTFTVARPPAYAAPDLTKTDCSITLTLKDMEGGTVALYRVAGIKQEQGIDTYDISVGDFADSETAARIPGLSQRELDAQNRALSAKLVKEAEEQKLTPRATAVNTDNKVAFRDLSVGLYLIQQTVASRGDKKLTPFLISIPQQDAETGEEIYDVVSQPKTGYSVPLLTPSPTPPRPTVTPSYPIYTPNGDTPKYTKLPQTGQLWWPVPVMAALGLALLVAGVALRRRED